MKDKISMIRVHDSRRTRVVAFHSYADILAETDQAMRTILVSKDQEHAEIFFSHACDKWNCSVNLEPIRDIVCSRSETLTLGDASRFHNDLICSFATRGVLPHHIHGGWHDWANELLSPIFESDRLAIDIGIRDGMNTDAIISLSLQIQDKTEFSPSSAMIKSLDLSLKFIDMALQFDLPDDCIYPYCLRPCE
jgi:hypothetical protein